MNRGQTDGQGQGHGGRRRRSRVNRGWRPIPVLLSILVAAAIPLGAAQAGDTVATGDGAAAGRVVIDWSRKESIVAALGRSGWILVDLDRQMIEAGLESCHKTFGTSAKLAAGAVKGRSMLHPFCELHEDPSAIWAPAAICTVFDRDLELESVEGYVITCVRKHEP